MAISLLGGQAMALPLDIEEQRLNALAQHQPELLNRYQPQLDHLLKRYRADPGELTVTRKVAEDANALWRTAVEDVQSGVWDDRPLYWHRLALRRELKTAPAGFSIAPWQRQILLSTVENASRGMSDIQFDESTEIRILLTGFDPFQLDQQLDQSNPSGLAALALDGKRWQVNGQWAQIESVLIPVRFQDFDDGLIESLLTPYLRDNSVDLILTVSMGRDQFDLERFPGRNRSASAPDNRNVHTGASKSTPLPPSLNGAELHGPEFVEFSLPAAQMQQATGPYAIRDNRTIRTLNGKREAQALHQLDGTVSVEGSGGGYLSNEISYRSLLLKQLLGSPVPIGHIHTPKVNGFEPAHNRAIVEQLHAMIEHAALAL
ncbi:hypothetical protein GCM10023333_03870 [Ferrimonas pelagia]|uniref:Pyrrolidone-carboxylate peptidase n=1 Tax=Ferrimonas pelagia TaxID=1177826 RepID=A0ABP9EK15_9GAMM